MTGGGVSLEQRLRWRERPSKEPVMLQTWTDLLFVHWEVPAELIQATLPPGLHVDTFEGRAYVGVIPFFMRHIRPRDVPPLPWISYFLEMNVRAYVHDASGTPGVWFYSLDCNQPLAVWLARSTLGLPYEHARMRARRGADGRIEYRSARRKHPAAASFSYRLDPATAVAEPGSLEFFLVERYLLFTRHRGGLFRAQVHHLPYPLHPVTVDSIEVRGFSPDSNLYENPPAHQLASSGVSVEIFSAEPVAS